MPTYSKNNSRRNRPKYHISFLVISFVLVVGVCFAIYMRTGKIEVGSPNESTSLTQEESDTSIDSTSTETDATETTLPTTQEPPIQGTSGNPIALSESVGMDYFNDCLFIGDSVSMGLATYQIIDTKSVYATLGMNISSVLTYTMPEKGANGDDPSIYYKGMTVVEALASSNAKNVYIMLGSNGISWLSNDFMTTKYTELIQNVRDTLPQSKVYVISIPPVATVRENMSQSDGRVLNSAVDEYNSELLKMANDLGVYFVDLNTALKNNEGKLSDEMSAKDGLHFNPTTYDKMLEYIMTHVAK